MDRLDRLDQVARILRDRPGVTAGELATELSVSIRSIFRDLDRLRERGYPVEADRGRGGGVRLAPNWGLGRVLLSTEEGLCTLLALAISEKLSFPMFAPEISRARRKIVDAFPASDRRKLAPLRERILVGAPLSSSKESSYGTPSTAAMRLLQLSFVREMAFRADYIKENGEQSTRRLEPHVMLIKWPAWYLLCFDHGRGAPRAFRFDRFRNVELEDGATGAFRARPRQIIAEMLGPGGTLPMQPV